MNKLQKFNELIPEIIDGFNSEYFNDSYEKENFLDSLHSDYVAWLHDDNEDSLVKYFDISLKKYKKIKDEMSKRFSGELVSVWFDREADSHLYPTKSTCVFGFKIESDFCECKNYDYINQLFEENEDDEHKICETFWCSKYGEELFYQLMRPTNDILDDISKFDKLLNRIITEVTGRVDTDRVPLTIDDVRELVESDALDPVLVYLTETNKYEVRSSVNLGYYNEPYEVISEQSYVTGFIDGDWDNPTLEDLEALVEHLTENLGED